MSKTTNNQQRPVSGATASRSSGSHEIAHRRHGASWLPWLILGLLALLGGIWALANAADDDDDDTSDGAVATTVMSTVAGGATGGATGATAAPGAGSGTPGAAATSVPAGAGGATGNGAAGAAGAAGTLVASGQDLFGAGATPGGLGTYAGAQATGATRVESVVSDEGFWVGSSPEQRIFVYLTPEARGNDGESPFQVAAGQMVNLTGTVTPLDSSVAAGVEAAEGADQLATAGFYVKATAIELAG